MYNRLGNNKKQEVQWSGIRYSLTIYCLLEVIFKEKIELDIYTPTLGQVLKFKYVRSQANKDESEINPSDQARHILS